MQEPGLAGLIGSPKKKRKKRVVRKGSPGLCFLRVVVRFQKVKVFTGFHKVGFVQGAWGGCGQVKRVGSLGFLTEARCGQVQSLQFEMLRRWLSSVIITVLT